MVLFDLLHSVTSFQWVFQIDTIVFGIYIWLNFTGPIWFETISFCFWKKFRYLIVKTHCTSVTSCEELADFCASRDCCCVWDLAAVDDIVSHVSDGLAANAFADVFDGGSHLSGAFSWPCSDAVTLDRLTDDIEKNAHTQFQLAEWNAVNFVKFRCTLNSVQYYRKCSSQGRTHQSQNASKQFFLDCRWILCYFSFMITKNQNPIRQLVRS